MQEITRINHVGLRVRDRNIALEITNVESVKEQLESLEIDITETVEFGGAAFFFIRDPDDNVIEFHKPA